MAKEIEGRPWYALIAGAMNTMEPAGRVLAELVSREECSDAARYAQVLVINELAQHEGPFDLLNQLKKMSGDKWHPGDVNYFFLRCTDSRGYRLRLTEMMGSLGTVQTLSVPEICFEHGVERAWGPWLEKVTETFPGMPEGLQVAFREAVQRRLRRELAERIHGVICAMPDWLKKQGITDYGTKLQLNYAEMMEGLTISGAKFLGRVEARAAALLAPDEKEYAEPAEAENEQSE